MLFQNVRRHLGPRGIFIFDEHHSPEWARSKCDTVLEVRKVVVDPITGQKVRLQCNYMRDEMRKVVVRYDFIDWLEADRIIQRRVRRISFRYGNINEVTDVLKRAGFSSISILGNWKGEPYDHEFPDANETAIFVARTV
jgi:hypothetical protein